MMRFEFDSNGYVSCILYGCTTGNCTEYTGLVPAEPEEYADMDDWADRAQVQAYYLDSKGNLAYDVERAESLCAEGEVVLEKYTAEQVKALGIFEAVYPVGSLYMSLNDVDPAILFGGTWEKIEDRFLLAAGSTSAGETGGAKSYDLSVSHKHTAPVGYSSTAFGTVNVNGTVSTGSGKGYRTVDTGHSGTLSSNITGLYTSNATVSDTIPTMPPYMAVYVWQRTE